MTRDFDHRSHTIAPLDHSFRVGDWLVEPAWNRLVRSGQTTKLEPRVMRVLAALAREAGRPVTRSQLLEAVWPDLVVNEEALSRAVSELRRVLGDDAKTPRYIETIRKGGYCLIAPLAPAERSVDRAPFAFDAKTMTIIAALVIVSVAAFVVLNSQTAGVRGGLEWTPITSATGREIDPAISTDGRAVAYVASVNGQYDLFVQAVEAGVPTRVTDDPEAEGHPVWSPDSTQIAYVRLLGENAAVYAVTVTNGRPRKLFDLSSWSYGLDWSPNGRSVAYVEMHPDEVGIGLYDLETGSTRRLTKPPKLSWDAKPAFSPDGRRLAFLRGDVSGQQQIYVTRLDRPDTEFPVLTLPKDIRGLDWSADGRALIFSRRSNGKFSLWRVDAQPNGVEQPFRVADYDLFNPSSSPVGRLVAESVVQDRDIWSLSLDGTGAREFLASTYDDFDAEYSPGGLQVAFVSERSGAPEIWVKALTDEYPTQLTHLRGGSIGRPVWSRDGRAIAFVANNDASTTVYIVTVAGGSPRPVLTEQRNYKPLGWSVERDKLLISSNDGSGLKIRKVDLQNGYVESVYEGGAMLADLSPAGDWIYALSQTDGSLVRISTSSGAADIISEKTPTTRLRAISARNDSVYYIGGESASELYEHFTDGSDVTLIGTLPDSDDGNISVSPDGESILYTTRHELANDIVQISYEQ